MKSKEIAKFALDFLVMKKALLFLVIVFLVSGLEVRGQGKELDSLNQLLEKAAGLKKIDLLSEISRQYYQINPEKGIEYGESAIRMADSMKVPSAKSKALNSLGANYLGLSKKDQARSFFKMARSNALLFGDSLEFATATGRLGILCHTQGKYDSALA